MFDVVDLMLVHFVASRYGHRTKCQSLQVPWGYFAIYLVRENGAIRSWRPCTDAAHGIVYVSCAMTLSFKQIFAPPPVDCWLSQQRGGGAFQCLRLRCCWRCGPHARICFVACGYSQVLGVSTCGFCGATMRCTQCENGGITL